MRARLVLPLLFGVVGTAILLSLGTWQVKRLIWKEDILAQIEARIVEPEIALPANPTPEQDEYQSVEVTGEIAPDYLRVLVSHKRRGAGYRIISPLQLEDRRVMLDRGFIKVADPMPEKEILNVHVIGNILWPDEVDGYTPTPDLGANIWYAREVDTMAAALGTDPILIVARDIEGDNPALTVWPVGTEGIPNDHLGYAITWFSLAAVWLGMTAAYLWRIRRRTQ